MRNRYLDRMNNRVKVRIVGSNINNYLKRVIKNKVSIVRLIPISYKEVHVILDYSEYKKLKKIKSIYEVSIIDNLGSRKVRYNISKNIILLFWMVVGFFGIVFLSNVIFRVDIIHQDSELREKLESELGKYGVVKYSLKKNYLELEKIEDQILESNKDILEWIEISIYGTKYIVRVEERKLNKEDNTYLYQSIVSRKDCVLVRVDALRGEKVKFVNDYVRKGETVIDGYIMHPDNTKVATMAEGSVYGEVWYQVRVDYPIVYQESNLTGRKKRGYVFYFLNHRFGLFDFDEFRSFDTRSKVLISSNLLGIKFVREVQYEADVRDEVYTEDIARSKAIDYVKDRLVKDNDNIESIRDVKILSETSDEDSIEFNLFLRVIEDVGEIVSIEEGVEENA